MRLELGVLAREKVYVRLSAMWIGSRGMMRMRGRDDTLDSNLADKWWDLWYVSVSYMSLDPFILNIPYSFIFIFSSECSYGRFRW